MSNVLLLFILLKVSRAELLLMKNVDSCREGKKGDVGLLDLDPAPGPIRSGVGWVM